MKVKNSIAHSRSLGTVADEAAEIQRTAENAPRWPDMNTKVEKCVVCAALLNMAVEPLAMCYPGLVEGN
jgi:hypothetical protein